MISITHAKQYCKDPIELIENYQEAMSDETQIWDCHHKKEIELGVGRKELIDIGLYYNQPASDLIFLTQSDHTRLHKEGENNPMYGRKGELCPSYGQKHSEERKQKRKQTLTLKGINYEGENNPMYGQKHSEEAKQKMSDAKKGRKHSEETIAKITKYKISKEELYDLYIIQNKTMKEISNMFNCRIETIHFKLKNYGIKKRKTNESKSNR